MSPDEFINACARLFPAARDGKITPDSGVSGFARRVGLKPDTVHEELRRRRRAGNNMPQHYATFVMLLEEIEQLAKLSRAKLSRKKATAKRVQAVSQMMAQGMNFTEISKSLELTPSALYQFRKLHMPDSFQPKGKVSSIQKKRKPRTTQKPDRIPAVITLRENGMKWAEIAAELGISRESLQVFREKWMPETIAKKGKFTEEVLKEIERMSASGMMITDIAKHFGTGTAKIHELRREGKISLPHAYSRGKTPRHTLKQDT